MTRRDRQVSLAVTGDHDIKGPCVVAVKRDLIIYANENIGDLVANVCG